jgi:two-component sensor histidine kinase
MIKFFNSLINIGVKPNYQPWEIYLTRKLNLISSISMFNLIIALVFFEFIGNTQIVFECILSLVLLPFLFLLNKHKNYIWTAYGFYLLGFSFLASMCFKQGIDSYIILFYFPMMISMIQLLGRRETIKHLIVISVFCFFTIVIIAIGYKVNIYNFEMNDTDFKNARLFNIILSFVSALAFNISLVSESISQEDLIEKMLREKEILLAEVFHRVKNNMNIVTSLLNLKKDISDSQEVKDALEDCRNRVFSMALVHRNIFNNNSIVELNFKTYIENLTAEIRNSLGDNKPVDIRLDTELVMLDLSNAIPCGLILNELIINSFKYATTDNNLLMIDIKLRYINNFVELEVRDNGKGLPENWIQNNGSLGMELINSLSQQIDGTHLFRNDNGLVFRLKFNLKSRTRADF